MNTVWLKFLNSVFLCIKNFFFPLTLRFPRYFKQKCSNFCSMYVIEQNLGYSKGWTSSSWFKGMLLNRTLFGIARRFYYQEIRSFLQSALSSFKLSYCKRESSTRLDRNAWKLFEMERAKIWNIIFLTL